MKVGEQELLAVRTLIADSVFRSLETIMAADQHWHDWETVCNYLIGVAVATPVVNGAHDDFLTYVDRASKHPAKNVGYGAIEALKAVAPLDVFHAKLVEVVRSEGAVAQSALDALGRSSPQSIPALVDLVCEAPSVLRSQSLETLAEEAQTFEVPAAARESASLLWGAFDGLTSTERDLLARTIGMLRGPAVCRSCAGLLEAPRLPVSRPRRNSRVLSYIRCRRGIPPMRSLALRLWFVVAHLTMNFAIASRHTRVLTCGKRPMNCK